jgi:hypothetical protein
MVTVSILIPAYKSRHLAKDRGRRSGFLGDVVTYLNASESAPIVAVAGDSRVRYFRHGLLDARRNAQAFLNKA